MNPMAAPPNAMTTKMNTGVVCASKMNTGVFCASKSGVRELIAVTVEAHPLVRELLVEIRDGAGEASRLRDPAGLPRRGGSAGIGGDPGFTLSTGLCHGSGQLKTAAMSSSMLRRATYIGGNKAIPEPDLFDFDRWEASRNWFRC